MTVAVEVKKEISMNNGRRNARLDKIKWSNVAQTIQISFIQF